MEGEEWDELQRNLMATIPVYDRINRFATLGQVSRWRKMVRQKLPQGRVLEIGCGAGSFAEDVVGIRICCSWRICMGLPKGVGGQHRPWRSEEDVERKESGVLRE